MDFPSLKDTVWFVCLQKYDTFATSVLHIYLASVMSNHIIILSTTVDNTTDLQYISQEISAFPEIAEWSVDLEDCDKILRVVCDPNIGDKLVKQLGALGIYAEVLEVFNENGSSLGQNTDRVVAKNI
jgi:hypothetical protein